MFRLTEHWGHHYHLLQPLLEEQSFPKVNQKSNKDTRTLWKWRAIQGPKHICYGTGLKICSVHTHRNFLSKVISLQEQRDFRIVDCQKIFFQVNNTLIDTEDVMGGLQNSKPFYSCGSEFVFTDSASADNSSLGIDVVFIGASFDFALTNLQFFKPLSSVATRYACSDASLKWCSWYFPASSTFKHLRTLIVSSCCSCWTHWSHFIWNSYGITSSHSSFIRHRSNWGIIAFIRHRLGTNLH